MMIAHDEFPGGEELERYRNYLRLLARVQLGARAGGRMEASDLVQQTLLEAYQKRQQFRGESDGERAAWLRTILARNVADAIRAQGRLKRDAARERSLERSLAESSVQLGDWLAAEGPSPSEFAQRHEQAIHLADALAQLPVRPARGAGPALLAGLHARRGRCPARPDHRLSRRPAEAGSQEPARPARRHPAARGLRRGQAADQPGTALPQKGTET